MSNNTLEFKIAVNAETGEVVTLRKEFDGLNQATQKTSNSIKHFTDKLANIAKIAIASIAIYEITSKVKELAASFIETSAKFEKFSIMLETLDNSAKKAAQDMSWIKNFAKTTPYEIDQVTEAFVRLKSYGFNATKDLKTLGDTAAAFARPLQDSVEALADATTGEFERLKAFGIRTKATAEKVAFQWSDSSGQIRHIVIDNNSKIIESTLLAIWNNRYAGGMDKLSNSWEGIISNISDSWTNFKADAAKISFKEAKKSLKNFETSWNIFLGALKKPLSDFSAKLVKTFSKDLTAKNMIDVFSAMIRGFGFVKDAITGVELIIETLKLAFYGLAEVVAAAFEPVRAMLNNLIALNNKIANSWVGKKTGVSIINFHYESSLPDISKKIVKIENNINNLAHSLHKGRNEAEKFTNTLNKSFQEEQKKTKKAAEAAKKKIKSTTKEIGQKGALGADALAITKNNDNLKQQQSLYQQIHNLYIATLPKEQQLVEWKKQELQKINQITDTSLKQKAIKELNLVYQAKQNNLLKQQEKIISTIHKQVLSMLSPQQKLDAWYQSMLIKISKIKDIAKRTQGLLDLKSIYNKKEDKIKQNQLGFDDKTYKAYNDLSKKFGTNSAKVFAGALSDFMKSGSLNDLFNSLGKKLASKGIAGAIGGFVVQHLQQAMSYIFDHFYKKIRNKYTGSIENYRQQSRDYSLQANAYNAFGYEGQGAVASYKADIASSQAAKNTYLMDYKLMERSKQYKAVTQHIMEVGAIAAGATAAAWFSGGAILQGLNMALNAQNWADKATGFKKFQSQFIQAADTFKQTIRKLANDLIQISGNVYKSIKDYRSIFDKLSNSKTYKIQNYKESLNFISKYSDLTTSSLMNLTQNVLKASKGFVEGAVKTTKDIKNLVSGNIFKKYGLAIDALNSKFKNSLGVIANLVDIQRKAKDAIRDYIAELKGSLGDTAYEKRYTQQQFAQTLQDYYAGKVDGSTLLEKAKAYQSAGGDISKIIKTLQGVETQSTKDYLKGILNATTKFSAVGLPQANIKAIQSPQVETLNVIKDTKNILQRITDVLIGGMPAFKNLLSGILSGVKEIVALLKGIFGVVSHIITAIEKAVSDIINGLMRAATYIVNGIIKGISSAFRALGHILNGAWSWTKNAINNVYNWTKEGINKTYKWTKQEINNVYSWSKKSFDDVWKAVKKVTDSIKNLGKGIGKSAGGVFKGIKHLFASGGYTGIGLGQRDSTGEVVAGVVHAGEWVAPKWMVNSMPNVFNALESLRVSHSTNNSLFKPVVNVAVDLNLIRETNSILQTQVTIQKKMLRLMQKFDEEGIKCVS